MSSRGNTAMDATVCVSRGTARTLAVAARGATVGGARGVQRTYTKSATTVARATKNAAQARFPMCSGLSSGAGVAGSATVPGGAGATASVGAIAGSLATKGRTVESSVVEPFAAEPFAEVTAPTGATRR